MGLFVARYPDSTWEQDVETAEANLRLLREQGMKPGYGYIIGLAASRLGDAEDKAARTVEEARGSAT